MDKIKKYGCYFLVFALSCCVMSCAQRAKTPGFSSRYDVKRYAYLGLANIKEGRYQAARQYIAAGLREDPRNCPLNFFNGLSYQLEGGEDGSLKMQDLARVGYENAMRACPDDPWAFYYNGTLAAQQDDYVLAEKMFAIASDLSGNRVSIFLKGYLYAAYRLGDITAMKHILKRLKSADPNNELVAKLERQFKYIKTPKQSLRRTLGNASATSAQKKPNVIPKQVLVDGILILSRETASSNRGVNLLNGLQLQYGNTSTTPGLLYSTNNAGLPANYSGLVAAGGAAASVPFSKQIINTISVPMVQYSLNIFNNADEDSEIVARPSLTVEDGHPASYFSGTTLVLGITGSTAGTISSLDLGVSMTLTPHFQPDGSIDLDIVMGREFIIPQTTNTSFTQVAQTLKESTSTTVNIHYGETIILSTLYDTRTDKTQNSTPFLSKIPLIKYFFSNKTSSTVQTNLITLLTPIKPITFDAKTTLPSQTQLTDYYKHYINEDSHISAILNNLRGLGIYTVKSPIAPDLKSVKTLGSAEQLEFNSMYGASPTPEATLPDLPVPR